MLKHVHTQSVFPKFDTIVHTAPLKKVNVRFKTCGDGTAGEQYPSLYLKTQRVSSNLLTTHKLTAAVSTH